jgi:hypothetical protein
VIEWIKEILALGIVSVADFAAGLGRINYVANVLIYDRPLLGVLYTWGSAICRSSTTSARIPWAVRIVLHWVSLRLGEEKGRMIKAAELVTPNNAPAPAEKFRTDAKATDTAAWIGGWETAGSTDTLGARWFSLEILPDVFPWVFIKKDPKRVIAALELLATIVAVIYFGKKGTIKGCTTIRGGTDNKANTFVATKLLSTKFPLTILVMELIAQLRVKGCQVQLDWVPREDNVPADDLTNSDFSKFSPANRLDFRPQDIPLLVLPQLQVASTELFLQLQKEKADLAFAKTTGITSSTWGQPRLKPTDRLKWRSPW